MEEHKRRKRRAYLDSFQKDSNGNYLYQGDLYVFKPRERELRQELARLWGAAFAMLAALTAAGCLDAPGTGQSFYVLIPYMISLIAGISVCWALGRLTAGGGELRAYVYEATVEQLPVRSGFAIFGAGAAILGELVYILKNGTEGKGIGCVIFLVLEGFVCGMTLIIKKQSSKMEWEKTILTETEKR